MTKLLLIMLWATIFCIAGMVLYLKIVSIKIYNKTIEGKEVPKFFTYNFVWQNVSGSTPNKIALFAIELIPVLNVIILIGLFFKMSSTITRAVNLYNNVFKMGEEIKNALHKAENGEDI